MYVKKKGIGVYTTHSKKVSAFAEQNVRPLKNIIYRYIEDEWTYSYITKLQDFVNTVSGRTDRVTKMAPNKITNKYVPYLPSLKADASSCMKNKLNTVLEIL